MQVGADKGERAEQERRFEERRQDDERAPTGSPSTIAIVRRAAPRDALVARRAGARQRIDGEFAQQRRARRRAKIAGKDEEHGAPAEPVAEDAAGRLAEQLAA